MSFVNVPTIMLSGFVAQAMMAILFWRNWRSEPQRQEYLIWAASCGTASLGLLMTALYSGSYSLGSVTIGPGLLLMSLALAWQGLGRFDHRPVDLNLASAGPLLWMALTSIVPVFQVDVAARLALWGVLTAAYAGLVVYEHRLSLRVENLPTRRLIVTWFAVHGAVALLAAPAALAWPLAGDGDPALVQPLWYGLLALEFLAHGIIAGISVYLLVKERLQLESQWVAATDTLTGLVNRATLRRFGRVILRPLIRLREGECPK